MAYKKNLFLSYFVQIILIHNTLFVQKVNVMKIKGNLPKPSLLSKILNDFLGPVIKTLPENNSPIDDFQETLIDKVIREKVKELQPFLQDNYDEKLMLEDTDETTIIEFLPKTNNLLKNIEDDSFKSRLNKYKMLKDKIKKALKKESVSGKTKNLVVKTLDGFMKSLLSRQCNWKKNLRAGKPETSSDLAKKWNNNLQNMKELLLSFVGNRSVRTRRSDDVLTFLRTFQTVFRSITEDIDVISKKYKISCNFIPKEHKNEINALRNNWDKTDLEEDQCNNIVVCSGELREFMVSFYIALNDTLVNLVKNYIEMYTRDVNLDNEIEKDIIISILNKIVIGLEEGMKQVFIKETQKLMLDKHKKSQANVNILSNYVTNMINSVKDPAKQLLKSELLVLRERVLSIILDDLNVNLDVDLENLEMEFVRKICEVFHNCNSKYKGRRQGSRNYDKNNIHVQVKLTLNKSMTDVNRKVVTAVAPRNSTIDRFKNSLTNVTVTRTTLMKNVTSL